MDEQRTNENNDIIKDLRGSCTPTSQKQLEKTIMLSVCCLKHTPNGHIVNIVNPVHQQNFAIISSLAEKRMCLSARNRFGGHLETLLLDIRSSTRDYVVALMIIPPPECVEVAVMGMVPDMHPIPSKGKT